MSDQNDEPLPFPTARQPYVPEGTELPKRKAPKAPNFTEPNGGPFGGMTDEDLQEMVQELQPQYDNPREPLQIPELVDLNIGLARQIDAQARRYAHERGCSTDYALQKIAQVAQELLNAKMVAAINFLTT